MFKRLGLVPEAEIGLEVVKLCLAEVGRWWVALLVVEDDVGGLAELGRTLGLKNPESSSLIGEGMFIHSMFRQIKDKTAPSLVGLGKEGLPVGLRGGGGWMGVGILRLYYSLVGRVEKKQDRAVYLLHLTVSSHKELQTTSKPPRIPPPPAELVHFLTPSALLRHRGPPRPH